MISKLEFKSVLDEIKKIHKFEDDLSSLVIKYGFDYINFPTLEAVCVNLLNRIFKLDDNTNWGTDIDYFIYDLDFGKNWKPGMVTDKDGNDIDLSTVEKLYDYLTNTHGQARGVV